MRLRHQPLADPDRQLRPIGPSGVLVGRDVRDPLRIAVRLELSSGAEDLDSGVGRNHIGAALDARARVEDAALLLDDLGWSDGDARKTFAITMPVNRLLTLLGRLDHVTTHALEGYSRMLRTPAWLDETAQERRDRLDAIREFADRDLETRTAVIKLRAALDNAAA